MKLQPFTDYFAGVFCQPLLPFRTDCLQLDAAATNNFSCLRQTVHRSDTCMEVNSCSEEGNSSCRNVSKLFNNIL